MRRDRWLLTVAVGALVVGAFYLRQALARYAAGDAFIDDFGFFRSALANIDAGRLFSALPDANYPILADHAAYVLYPIALLYALWPTATFMLGLQAFALTAASIPLYLWAREATGRHRLAAAVAAVWLLSPWVETTNLFDWHPDALWPLAVFGLLLALQRRRILPAAAWLTLALACKDVLVLPLVGVGAWWWLRARGDPGGRCWGAAIAGAALAVFAFDIWLTGSLAPTHAAELAGYYGYLLGARSGLVPGVLFALGHPLHTLDALTVPQGWALAAIQLALVVFAPLVTWSGAALVALPGLLTVAASRWSVVSGQLQYPLALGTLCLPPLVLWLADAKGLGLRLRAYGLTAATLIGVASLDLPQWTEIWVPSLSGSAALLALVPRDASIATTNNGPGAAAGAHVREVELSPGPGHGAAAFYATAQRARYVLWSPRASVPTAISVDVPLVERNLRTLGYRMVGAHDTWQLWRRTSAAHGALVECRPALGRLDPGGHASIQLGRLASASVATLHLATRSSVAVAMTGWGYASLSLVTSGTAAGTGSVWMGSTPWRRVLDVPAGTWRLVVTNVAWAQGSRVSIQYAVHTLNCPAV